MKIKKILQLGALVLALSGCVQHKEFRREVDLNKDSRTDVIELKNKGIYAKLNLGNDSNGNQIYSSEERMSQEYYKVADMEIKDSDGDGNLDIIYFVRDTTEPFSRIRYGKGDGTFSVDLANRH